MQIYCMGWALARSDRKKGLAAGLGIGLPIAVRGFRGSQVQGVPKTTAKVTTYDKRRSGECSHVGGTRSGIGGFIKNSLAYEQGQPRKKQTQNGESVNAYEFPIIISQRYMGGDQIISASDRFTQPILSSV